MLRPAEYSTQRITRGQGGWLGLALYDSCIRYSPSAYADAPSPLFGPHDRSGGEFVSSGGPDAVIKTISCQLIFDRPFLVIMQQRGRKEPFLLIWVDSPSLLVL